MPNRRTRGNANDRVHVNYGGRPSRSRERFDLRPSADFHSGPHWGRRHHQVSFRGSSDSYYAGRGRGFEQGNVRVSLMSDNRIPAAPAMPAIPPLFILVAVALVVVLLLVFGVRSCMDNQQQEEQAAQAAAAAEEESQGTVTFLAVGDNLPDAVIGQWADAQAGEEGDDEYDYNALFDNIRDYVKAADLAYVDEEAVIGGEEIGPVGYPTFNTTDAMADALEGAGFDLVGAASNHTFDHGLDAVRHSAKVLNSKEFAMVGVNESDEDVVSYRTVESKGITFAFLDYTYGLNGHSDGSVPSYAVNVFSKDRAARDVAAAKEEADVVIVAMHWGTEKLTEPDQYEKTNAQYLADLGVDLVIGSHPHVIQPMSWIRGESGNRTLVCYSLGNFLSNHDNSNVLPQLEGMMTCEFSRDEDTGDVHISNATFVPLVNHRVLKDEASECEFSVYPLKDYTDELAKAHYDFGDLEDPIAWMQHTVQDVMGDRFAIDMGEIRELSSADASYSDED